MRWYRAFQMWYLRQCIKGCDRLLRSPVEMDYDTMYELREKRKYFVEEYTRLEKKYGS